MRCTSGCAPGRAKVLEPGGLGVRVRGVSMLSYVCASNCPHSGPPSSPAKRTVSSLSSSDLQGPARQSPATGAPQAARPTL
eukprot:1158938-Pelagomonas_calceolata.AAC.12